MNFVILGAGLMGRAALYDLVLSDVANEIVIADYDLARAESVAGQYGASKAHARHADVRQSSELVSLLRGACVVLNCTQYYYNLEVMRAALEAGVHYLDLGGLFHVTRQQLELNSDFQRIGRLALLGMGGTPGISNIAARYLADRLDSVDTIRIYDGSADFSSGSDPLSYTFSIATILDELTQEPVHFRDGEFVSVPPLYGEERVAFPKPIGRVSAHHSLHSEVATLPLTFRDKGVREVFFKINYEPALILAVTTLRSLGLLARDPIQLDGAAVSPRAVVEQLLKSRATSAATPQDIETIRVEVTGSQSGKARKLRLDFTARCTQDPAFSAVARTTGFPASIAAQMIARGDVRATGVLPPEQAVPATRFMKELESRGITISGAGWPAKQQTSTAKKARAA